MTTPDSGQPPDGVQLRLAGNFAVSRGGTPVAGPDLGSRKARTLLKLLAVERPRTVTAARIAEVLWGAAQPAGPAENIATFVSRLRRILGADVILGGRPGYRLGPPPAVQVDLDEAARWADEAERRLAAAEPALAVAAATRGHDVLAAGLVLEDEPDAEWAQPARVEQAVLLRRVRHVLAEAALAAGDPSAAAAAAVAAVSDDPYDERARRALMRGLAAGGEPARALATYAELRHLLAEELGADPAAQTQQLHLAVLREQELPPGGAAQPGGAAPGGTAPRGRSVPPDLPGRAAEVNRLRAAWNDAAAGHPALLLVSGEAGIGKTRLAAELTRIATATGGTVLAARCYETERSLFLQPFADAIAAVVRAMPPARMQDLAGGHAPVLARLVPEVAELLGPLPAARQDTADIERRRGFEAVTAFIRALADRGPVLLSLDDLQNAGRATVELLHYLARHAPRSQLLVIATVRAEEGAEVVDSLAAVSFRMDLGPLPGDAVATLAAAAGQADQTESIVSRTRGHTLFVVETLRSLAAGHAGVPESLEEAVLARVRRAGPAVEAALRAAAVLGASFDPATVAGLLGEAPQAAIAACAGALAARLLVVADRDYEFANDLVRDVLYTTTPAPTRQAYHRHAADLLTRKPETMAAHAAAAQDWPRAARGWLLAGEGALTRAAAADAVELLTRSLDAAARSGDREVQARALLTRGRAREALVEFDASVSDIEAAVGLSRDTGDQRLQMIGLLALGGDSRVARGRPVADAVEPLERGLSIAAALSDRAMEANLRARLAVLATQRLHFVEAVEQGRIAVRAARASGDEEALVAALDGQKTPLAYLGEIAPLAPVMDELEPLVRRLGDLYRLHWVLFESAFPALAAGDWPGAIARIESALDAHRRSGYGAHAGWHVSVLGAIARLQGRYDEAIGIGRRAVALSEAAPHVWTTAAAGAALGTTLLEAGAVDDAVTVLERALVAASQDGAEAIRLRCLAPLAEATGSTAILGEAAALLDGISAPDGSAFLTADGCYLAVARSWLARGKPELARAALAPLLEAAARVPWVAPLAGASLLDGHAAASLGLAEEATASLRHAAELGRRHGMPRIAREATTALG
jgi:DNA-binding SARP family transcriptional activator/tetratricopeptide (TPR) repeat protein